MRPSWKRLIIALIVGVIVLLAVAKCTAEGADKSEAGTYQEVGESPTATSTVSSVPTASATSVAPSPSSSKPSVSTIKARTCQAGTPVRFVWKSPGVSINASIEKTGLEGADHHLAAPKSKHTIGLYDLGPWPGRGKGNVLIGGHTYTDDSAVFKENFSKKIALGQVFSFVMDNGSTCTYKVTKIWEYVAKAGQYESLVMSEGWYNFNGPEQVFGVTCQGSWDEAVLSHKDVTTWIATPIN